LEETVERVLIVEDDGALRRSLERALGMRFAEVRSCGARAEATRLIDAWRPQLLLLDVQLPDGDAFDVLRDAARAPALPGVVAMSGSARAHLADALARLGARTFLVKPLTPESLDRAVDEALSAGGGAGAARSKEAPPARGDRTSRLAALARRVGRLLGR
jgi:DNA-binding NtrC family response regulator